MAKDKNKKSKKFQVVKPQTEKGEFHTAVIHFWPDIECLVSLVIIALGFVCRIALEKKYRLKVISSGSLRIEDWQDEKRVKEAKLDVVRLIEQGRLAQELEQIGYLFVDCGGGFLDHHGRQDSLCTIEILTELVGLKKGYEWFLGIAQVIAAQDKQGTAIARDPDYRNSSWPNTARTLRNLITGWNLLYRNNPLKVVVQCVYAFKGVFALTQDKAKRTNTASPDIANENYFLMDPMVAGLKLTKVRKQQRKEFQDECRLALDRMEVEWKLALRDFETAQFRVLDIPQVVFANGVRWVESKCVVVAGQSESYRFGSVARMKANEYAAQRKLTVVETVIIQHRRSDTHFNVSVGSWTARTKEGSQVHTERDRSKMVLNRVAAALRAAEIRLSDPDGRAELIDPLEQVGNVYFDLNGKVLSAIFLAPFKTACGNAWNTNPDMPPCSLTAQDVYVITVLTLLGQPFDKSQTCHRQSSPYCKPSCGWRCFELYGCARYRQGKAREFETRTHPSNGSERIL
ncbi:MAG: hypothetical protein ABII72_01975 [Parcubacteria group bacterium]